MMELCLENLTKRYGNFTALREVNLRFTPGIYGLLGPNGAGKSTMMKLITDTLLPDEGKILYCGKDIRRLKETYRETLGYMPQQQGMYESFTAGRFLTYMAALKGIEKKEIKGEVERVLKLVNLEQSAGKKLGGFSGGMKQRVLIAQAILGNPKILILDEPTAGLDPKERIRIRNLISKIAMEKIVLIATHVVSDIEFIAKEIVMLKKGEILGMESPGQWLKRLNGKVYEVVVEESGLETFQKHHLVSNIRKDEQENIRVRIIANEEPEGKWELAGANLEDLYLTIFEEEGSRYV